MLLWDRTKKLPKDLLKEVEDLYRESFPLEVRLQLAAWIEEHCSPNTPFNPQDATHQANGVSVANQMLAELEQRISTMPNDPDKFLMKGKLAEIAENLRQTYSANPLGLYATVRLCLEKEMKIVAQAPTPSHDENELASQIRQQLTTLRQRLQDTSQELDRCRQEQEAFSVEYYAFREKSIQYDAFVQQHGPQHADFNKVKAAKENMEKTIRQRYLNLTSQRNGLLNVYLQIFNAAKEVQTHVLDKELIRWKREQQLSGNGNPMSMSLETLQEWCEGLADIIWATRHHLRQLEGLREKIGDPQNNINLLPELLAGVTELLSNLVTGTFIIEKQPPQVMKTNTRFTATVRLLVGGVLNVHMAAPSVSVSIVSESQANQLLASPSTIPKRKEDYSSGDILNGNGTMEYHVTTKQVSVSFRNLQLKKIKRTEKKGTESVMDEKFSVLFWTEFQVGELKFQLWTLSLPVVVIVHGNQEPQALATVTWDNAFAEWGRRPFVVPDKVTWHQMGKALSMKWAASCGSPLTDDNLYFLACKAFRNNNLPRKADDFNKMALTWSMFCKETLPDRNFTFWEWFYRILILTSNHMQRLWKEGFVMGFVTKQAAESFLLQKPNGTFLLRFSDSELGGVTIGYVKGDPYQQPSVFFVAPFTTKDLSQRSMADVIFDLGDLTTLFPDVPKEAFRKFCSSSQAQSQQPSSGGYVKHILVTQVEGVNSCDSNPPTPSGAYGNYEISSVASQQGDVQSPYGHEDMIFEDDNTVFVDQIDVGTILGLSNEFLGQN